MSLPGLVDHDASAEDNFHSYFTDFSTYLPNLIIPSHIAVYDPDNNDDAMCVAVLTPEPSLGSTKWTINGKWITIGVFRDEGRQPGVKPIHDNISWFRQGEDIIVYDSEKHQLIEGEEIKHSMTNVGSFTTTVTKLISDYVFITKTVDGGSSSGNSATNGSYYQGLREVNFYDEHVVFRLLPSFKLVPWSFVQSILASASPSGNLTRRALYEVTNGAMMKIPNTINKTTNYSVPYSNTIESAHFSKRFNQLYDESGNPLPLKYDSLGHPMPPDYADSKYKNNPVKLNNTLDYAIDGVPFNPRVYVFDFYGLEINNPERGPYYDIDLIVRNADIGGNVNNIQRRTDLFGNVAYVGKLYDEFGNVAIGVQENNALSTRKNILPISLDAFNHPIKLPRKRISNGL